MLAEVDPPDPNFTVIAHPFVPSVREVTKGLTNREAAAIKYMDDNLLHASALEMTLFTSINRAQGAHLAGNKTWEAKQLHAAHQYARQAAKLLKAEPKSFANVQNAFEGTTFTQVPDFSRFLQLLTSDSTTDPILQSAHGLEQFAGCDDADPGKVVGPKNCNE